MELLRQSGEIIAQRYRIVDQLGQGNSGTTYHAQDLQTGQRVALKALSLHRMTDWKVMELFEREAHVLGQLNHVGIPRYLNYFHLDKPQDRSFYLVQELAAGQSLAMWVQKGWHGNESEVRHIAIQLLQILIYLHQQNPSVIHRDIKPQNIIRTPDGRVFLVDFGAVQNTYHSTFMRGSTVVGTYGYMAPEQFRGQAVPATDLYGLGATLLFLLTHRSPTDLPTEGLTINFRSHVQISEEFAAWLETMVAPDVEDRFSSAQEALAVLEGKQRLKTQTPTLIPWKGLIAATLIAITAASVVNFYKYPLLGVLGITPKAIHEAAQKGDVDTVKKYLDKRVSVNSKDLSGKTLLHQAGSKQLIELLLANGADVDAKDKYQEETPLFVAVAKDYHHKFGQIKNERKDIVKVLLASGADVNAKNVRGQTPLFPAVGKYSVDNEQNEIITLLLAQGADITIKDDEGETPLHEAAKGDCQVDVIELLVANSADINAKNDQGKTPLHEAIASIEYYPQRNQEKEVIELLLAKGADINAQDNQGNTPLQVTIASGDPELVQLLKRYDINK